MFLDEAKCLVFLSWKLQVVLTGHLGFNALGYFLQSK